MTLTEAYGPPWEGLSPLVAFTYCLRQVWRETPAGTVVDGDADVVPKGSWEFWPRMPLFASSPYVTVWQP